MQAAADPRPHPERDPDEHVRLLAALLRLYTPLNRTADGVRVPTSFPKAELERLRAAGIAPHRRRSPTHAEIVRSVRELGEAYPLRELVRPFLRSLDGPGPPLSVALDAALLAHRMPSHRFTGRGGDVCRICGAERTETWELAERYLDWHITGGGLPGDVTWASYAAEHAGLWMTSKRPGAGRVRLARALLAIDALPKGKRAGAAIAAVAELGLFGPDKRNWRAQSLVESLGFAGVLEATPHHGLANDYVTFWARDERPNMRVEYNAPLGFWRSDFGVSFRNAKVVFGMTRAQASELAKRPLPERPVALRVPTLAAPKAKPAAASKRLKRRPPRAGDVWSIRVREDRYALVYVWSIDMRGGKPWAKVEYLDALLEAPACPEDLIVKERRDGRWQMNASRLEKTTGSALLAESEPAPLIESPEPDRIPNGPGKDLIHMADWFWDELTEAG